MANKGLCSLHEAVRRQDIRMIQNLLKAGANVNEQEKGSPGNTPLHIATCISSVEIMKLLLEAGADVHIRNRKKWTALQCAIDQPDLEKAKILIDAGADSNDKVGKYGRGALHVAVEQNEVAIVQHLLTCVANVNIKDVFFKQTPLHKAVISNNGDSHLNMIEVLLKNEAVDINAKDIEEKAPLHYLVGPWKGKVDAKVVELFLKFKPNLHLEDGSGGEIPLIKAIERSRNVEVVQALINHGSDVNFPNSKDGSTPLHFACKECDSEIIECLLKNGANINARNSKGHTPLICLLKDLYYSINIEKKYKTFLYLLQHNADVNIVWTYTEADDRFPKLPRLTMSSSLPEENKEKLKDEEKSKEKVVVEEENTDYSNYRNVLTMEHLKEIFWKKILEHLAKLQSLNTPIHPSILDTISNRVDYNDYFELCKEELALAKSTKLNDSQDTFYNLLVNDEKQLETFFAKNENLRKDYEKKFPIYGVLGEEQVIEKIKRRKFNDDSD